MKKLPIALNYDGFRYRQIMREKDVAIYEQRWNGIKDDSGSVAYKVIRIKRHNGFRIAGKDIPPAEVYPRSEEWGVNGFTLTNQDAAFAKMKKLLAK